MAKSIYLPGMHGAQPIPSAAVVGNILMSGGISGVDPDTGETPEDIEGQCANIFQNVRRIMEAAGGTPDDIVKFTVFLAPGQARDAINAQWVEMYPDEDRRPARHSLQHPGLTGRAVVQCEIMAVLSGPGA